MQVVFRCDASIHIGSGHVMRCLTLAEALQEQGYKILFICADFSGNLGAFINKKGFCVQWLPHLFEGASFCQVDAKNTIEILKNYSKFDWLILDHYALDREWEADTRPYVKKIMVIDDLANRTHDCDVLLDQNLFHDMTSRYQELIPETCKTLFGPQYALLRNEFFQERMKRNCKYKELKKLFVFFGGSDITNETGKVLQALQMLGDSNLIVDVVVGEANPKKNIIQSQCKKIKNANYYCQITNMASLMAKADFCIGGGGSSTWERCCIGLPSIVVPVADNQVKPMQELANFGAIILFNFERSPEGYLTVLQKTLCGHFDLQSIMETGMALYDGKGAGRVAREMIGR